MISNGLVTRMSQVSFRTKQVVDDQLFVERSLFALACCLQENNRNIKS